MKFITYIGSLNCLCVSPLDTLSHSLSDQERGGGDNRGVIRIHGFDDFWLEEEEANRDEEASSPNVLTKRGKCEILEKGERILVTFLLLEKTT